MKGCWRFAFALVATCALCVSFAHAGEEDAAASHDPGAMFRSGVASLAQGRFGEAIASFEGLADRGVLDAAVSYDRGLAYAARVRAGAEQPGDLGRAAHGFEEARELAEDRSLARDASRALSAVRAELARRRARAGDPVEIDHGISLGRSIVRLMPENAWAMTACLASLALTIGFIFWRIAQTPRRKVTGATTAAVAGGILLATSLIVYYARDARLHVREAVVIAGSRLLDESHIAKNGVAPVPEGARVRLVEEGTDFTRIAIGSASGYLPTTALLPLAKR